MTGKAVGVREMAMDSGVTDDRHFTLVAEILSLRGKFELLSTFQHLPIPQKSSIQYQVSCIHIT